MDTHLLDCDCTSKCRSKQHASDLLTLVTRGNLSQIQAYFNHCYNSCTITDEFGRNVLHMAASCRKWEVVDWLLTEKKINHQVKDIESGWTALHRSIFYGQITSALHLIHHGASLTSQDKEALTPLDIIRLDRPAYVEFQPTGPTDVYTWGTNANFTLGHSNQQSRKHPDLVEEFAKKSISIKQVVVCKYHSVFLSHNGQVYTCGHGQGGRLGHGNEQTYLTPRSLDTMADIKCTQIAAARDHTVMLAEGGVVYTCGLNSCHQLGQPQLGSKYTTPKPILTKLLKGKVITGIEACRFHTVLYCSDTVFTFGLNAGQLGFPKGEQYIQYPKKVSSLDHKETVISHVAASAAVTVCSTVKGDIYILHGYQCRKIATKQINVIKLVAHGGNLDNDVDKDLLQREKGDELTVLVLTASGKVFCWKRSDKSVLKRCCWNYSRQIFMSDMAISKQHMAFITPHGEAFMACFSKKKTKTSPASSLLARSPSVEAFTLSAEVELLEKEEIEEISLQRLALVNRAVRITSDPSGQNFAVLQSDPKTSLVDVPSVSDSGIGKQLKTFLEETNSLDNIHDVILKVQGHEIPAHKYILASRCEYFRKILSSQKSEGKKYKVDSSSGRSVQVIEVEKTNYEMFQMLVQYIYTEHCEMLNPGYKIKSSKKSGWETVDSGIDFDLDADFEELDICDIDGRESAFEIHKGQKKKTRKENKKSGKRRNKSLNEEDENDKKVISGPVKNLQSLAKKFGVPGLANRLDSAKCSKGVIYGIKKPNKKLRFERNKHRHLCDVSIQTDDGEALQCHKCVLVARLEYFRSMLGSGWFENEFCRY
ncbi:inhibitor of Bruton tyrosine kinase-like [Saccoglossus kowalevskii]